MGRVAPGGVVRVFHAQAGSQGEEITTNPGTGIYSAYWSVSGGFGSGVTRVELLVRGALEGAGAGGTDAVADQRVWAVLPASAESYGYDGAGRTVEDSLWHYTWNGMGRLVGMQRKAGSSVEPELTSEEMAFVYDAEGRRTQKTRTRIYANAPTKVERSKVFWTDWLPAYEELSVDGGTPSRRWFIWGQDVSGSWDGAGGIGGLLAIREEGGRTLLPVHDGLGNITAVIHAGTSDTVARYDYAPFGELLAESGDVNACPFRYQSKYYDVETGLSYFGFRYYSAKLGRWISRDPLGEDGGFNLYGYCGNDPVNGWDYLGMEAIMVVRHQEDLQRVLELIGKEYDTWEGVTFVKGFNEDGSPNRAWKMANLPGMTSMTRSDGKVFGVGKLTKERAVWFFDSPLHAQNVKERFDKFTWMAIAGKVFPVVMGAGTSGFAGATTLPNGNTATAIVKNESRAAVPGVAVERVPLPNAEVDVPAPQAPAVPVPQVATRSPAWSLGPAPRGQMIEQAWGHNLPNAFKTFDRFDNGVATSIKSFDLDLPSFSKPNGVWDAGRKAIDAAIDFDGYALQGVRITPQLIQQRTVRIAVPRPPNATQLSEFLRLQQYGADNGVHVTWEVF